MEITQILFHFFDLPIFIFLLIIFFCFFMSLYIMVYVASLYFYLVSFIIIISCFWFHGIRHRWTGRYEAHLWDKSTWNQNQNKKGKQGLSLYIHYHTISFSLHVLIRMSNIELKVCQKMLTLSSCLYCMGTDN